LESPRIGLQLVYGGRVEITLAHHMPQLRSLAAQLLIFFEKDVEVLVSAVDHDKDESISHDECTGFLDLARWFAKQNCADIEHCEMAERGNGQRDHSGVSGHTPRWFWSQMHV